MIPTFLLKLKCRITHLDVVKCRVLLLLEGAHVVTEHHLIEQFVPRLTYCLHHVAAAAAAIVLENHAHMGSLISSGMHAHWTVLWNWVLNDRSCREMQREKGAKPGCLEVSRVERRRRCLCPSWPEMELDWMICSWEDQWAMEPPHGTCLQSSETKNKYPKGVSFSIGVIRKVQQNICVCNDCKYFPIPVIGPWRQPHFPSQIHTSQGSGKQSSWRGTASQMRAC